MLFDHSAECEYMLWKILLIPVLVMTLKSAGAEPAEVERLIRQLGADDFTERQSAAEKLWALGPSVEPALLAAGGNQDLEIKTAANRILLRFNQGFFPDN